jgi:hypothetical protein
VVINLNKGELKDTKMKKQFENTAFPIISQYVNENHGFGENLRNSDAYKQYSAAMDSIKEFDGQRVEICFSAEMDFLTVSGGIKKGKIKIVEDRIRFYEGRKTARFYYLDAGLYKGWFATLIPTKITGLN